MQTSLKSCPLFLIVHHSTPSRPEWRGRAKKSEFEWSHFPLSPFRNRRRRRTNDQKVLRQKRPPNHAHNCCEARGGPRLEHTGRRRLRKRTCTTVAGCKIRRLHGRKRLDNPTNRKNKCRGGGIPYAL